MRRTRSPAARAAQRNNNAVARAPLLAYAGLLDEVGIKADWDGQQVADSDFANALEVDEMHRAMEARNRRYWTIYCAMLDEVIGSENREEVLADYNERWANHGAMQQWGYRLNYLCEYLARYLNVPPLAIHEVARCRAGASAPRAVAQACR